MRTRLQAVKMQDYKDIAFFSKIVAISRLLAKNMRYHGFGPGICDIAYVTLGYAMAVFVQVFENSTSYKPEKQKVKLF